MGSKITLPLVQVMVAIFTTGGKIILRKEKEITPELWSKSTVPKNPIVSGEFLLRRKFTRVFTPE